MAAQESCNLDKEEAEVLKPSSSTPHPPLPPSPPTTSSSSSSSSSTPNRPSPSPSPIVSISISNDSLADVVTGFKKHIKESQPLVRLGSRCSSCQKRVRLTGFRCRCGDLFCARHRHSETHNCSFDYKTKGREEISKANPLVRAAKIIKI